MNLYEIDSELRIFLEELYESVDENGEIKVDLDYSRLEELKAERTKKLESIALYIKELESEADAIEEEKKKLDRRAKSKNNKAKWLRQYLTTSLINNGDNEFETARCRISFRKSKGLVVDLDKLPKEYMVEDIKYKANNDLIKKAIDEGKTVEGAYLEERNNLQLK